MKKKRNTEAAFGKAYFALYGVIVLAFGALEFLASGIGAIGWGMLEISHGLFLPWKALILTSAGLIYLSGVKQFPKVEDLAKVYLASIMIWIVAGSAIWARIAASIPAEAPQWFNTWSGFVASYAPPYCPALFLLPFSLMILYYTRKKSR